MLVLSIHLSDLPRVFDFKGLFDLLEVKEEPSPEQEQMLLSLDVPALLTIQKEELLYKSVWNIQPQIVDLPWDSSADAIRTARLRFPSSILQGSFHGFDASDIDLHMLLDSMLSHGFDAVKIACSTTTAKQAMELLLFLKRQRGKAKLTCVPMGVRGQFGRLLAMTLGSYLSFCCLPGRPLALGQIDIATLHALYSVSKISSHTQRFALVGENVDTSFSHKTHTKVLRNFGIDGLYVKIPIQREEAKEVLPYLEALEFSGVSVTTPLKEVYGTYLHPINTMNCKGQKVVTTNTDTPALIDSLAKFFPLKGTTVLVLGAGAVGRAAFQELSSTGALVSVYNRTFSKAYELTSTIGGTPVSDQMLGQKQRYDIVVNTTSAHHFPDFPSSFETMPFASWGVKLAAEFAFPEKTPFLEAAEAQGIKTITGTELWVRQAAKQFQWWCGIRENEILQYLNEELSCRQL